MDIEKAKKDLKGIDIRNFLSGMSEQSNYIVDRAEETNEAIETLLNELEKEEAKYRDLELKYEQNLKMCRHFRAELNKQDEIINEMAKFIAGLDIDELICKEREHCTGDYEYETCEECIKEYFTNKAENVGE